MCQALLKNRTNVGAKTLMQTHDGSSKSLYYIATV